jgi:hypothetical protein
VLQE